MGDNNSAPAQTPKKKCFVVMGFGEKVDLATGRTLDLDKSYRLIIKKAVEEAGLECIRADDIIHAGIIDKPMYEWLYEADLVVADLSTSNANAIYELGVRHALKPRTTIVIAESQFKFPFDLGHLVVRKYEHLGKGIDGEEADRAKGVLKDAITTLVGNNDETDSPVYTFLPTLAMPAIAANANVAAMQEPTAPVPAEDNTASMLLDMFKQEKKNSNWLMVIGYLNELLKRRPKDVYVKQQLALATYKSKMPTVIDALQKAKEILDTLNPLQTTDPETLGLWGAIHKRFWDVNAAKPDLDAAIWAYEKGFYLKNDYYNGINFAFLLNIRASVSEKRDAIADTVIAERIRKRVIELCNNLLNPGKSECEKTEAIGNDEEKFWLQASLVEAYFGIGDKDKANELKQSLTAPKEITGNSTPGNWITPQWMVDTMSDQLARLEALLEKAPSIE